MRARSSSSDLRTDHVDRDWNRHRDPRPDSAWNQFPFGRMTGLKTGKSTRSGPIRRSRRRTTFSNAFPVSHGSFGGSTVFGASLAIPPVMTLNSTQMTATKFHSSERITFPDEMCQRFERLLKCRQLTTRRGPGIPSDVHYEGSRSTRCDLPWTCDRLVFRLLRRKRTAATLPRRQSWKD